jgi:hypothetical protein
MTDFFIASFYGEPNMTYEEIEKLAGHRPVPAWVVKLVGDAVAAIDNKYPIKFTHEEYNAVIDAAVADGAKMERERIAKQFDSGLVNIRARGQK